MKAGAPFILLTMFAFAARAGTPSESNGATTPFLNTVAIQTFLDRQNLSCGCIDGVMGARTRAALDAWKKRQGVPAAADMNVAMMGSLASVFTVHVVHAGDDSALVPVPRTWPGKAVVTNLGYETILEAVAEKYHASQGAIRKLNPDAPWPNPPAGTVLTVPNPEPAPGGKAARLTISLPGKVIEAWDARGALLARFPCSIAADKSKRPVGELAVAVVAPNPNYTFDPAVYMEDPEAQAVGKKLVIPPGPNNPVGVAWIGLSLPGYGIHGTPKPEDVGVTESHGCFRLANWNAAKLLNMVAIGTPVVVTE